MKQVDHNQFWLIKDNPITKAGVFPYFGRQISPSLEPDKIYQVYRPAGEIKKAADTFKLVPLVDDHTMLGPGFTPAEEKGVHGVLGEDIKEKDGTLYADVKIFSEQLKREIQDGKKELSLGYFCRYDLTPGQYNGMHYDAVQKDLKGNHIALVDNGRMGHDVRVMDSMAFDAMDIVGNFQTGEKIMLNNDAAWEESKHKRDADGKFSSGGGGGSQTGKGGGSHFSVSSAYKKAKAAGQPEQEASMAELRSLASWAKQNYGATNKGKSIFMQKAKENPHTGKYSRGVHERFFRVKDENDVEDITHGVGGKDAAPEKENEMEKVKQAIEAIKALFADPEAGDKDGKLAEILGALGQAPAAGDACAAKDEDVDKRQLIDEIGGILKDKVSDEIIRTVIGKAEKIAYNDSEAGTADDEEADKDGVKEADEALTEKINGVENAVDAMPAKILRMLADREALYKQVSALVGTFDHAAMTEKDIAVYACDKLDDLKGTPASKAVDVLKGYLRAQKPARVLSMDAAPLKDEKDAGFEAYMKGEK